MLGCGFDAGTALAQEIPEAATEEAADRTVYSAEFYAPFAPQTVFDMLQRTPGFTLDEGAEVRGFADGAANVVVDGARPATKAGGLVDVLRQIPAAQVLRIEILRGGNVAQAPGHAVVANVVRDPAARGTGTAELVIERAPHGRVFPNVSATYARALGEWRVSVAGAVEWEYHPFESTRTIFDGAGEVVERQIETFPGRFGELALSGSASGPFAGGELTINGRYAGEYNRATQSLLGYPGALTDPPAWQSELREDETEHAAELGFDWTRAVGGGWDFKLVGLGTVGSDHSEQVDTYLEPVGTLVSVGRSILRQAPLELIARSTLAHEGSGGFKPELGMEVAWNRLDSRLSYTFDDGSGPVPVELPAANVRVTELRGQVFANGTYVLTPRITLEGELAVELSRIGVTGDAASSRVLAFPKPALAVLWQPANGHQVRLALRRTVGQLDFGDFAASVDANDDRPVGGNPELRPDQATRASLGYDFRHGEGTAVSAELWHEWHEDVLEFVPLPDGGQGIGNVPSARAWGLIASLTQPLQGVIPGGELRAKGEWTGSRLTDPLTGEPRTLSDMVPETFSIEFRQDIAAWKSAWGVSYQSRYRTSAFYVDEHDDVEFEAVWSVFAETTAFAGMKARLDLYAVGDERSLRRRQFYAPDRSGVLIGSELYDERVGGTYAILTLSRAF